MQTLIKINNDLTTQIHDMVCRKNSQSRLPA